MDKRRVAVFGMILLLFGMWGDGGAMGESKLELAGDFYERGVLAYKAGSWIEAAQWFRVAREILPSSGAMVQEVRSLVKAGESRRAGEVAVQLVSRYGRELIDIGGIDWERGKGEVVCIVETGAIFSLMTETLELVVDVGRLEVARDSGEDKTWTKIAGMGVEVRERFLRGQLVPAVTRLREMVKVLRERKQKLLGTTLPANPF